MTGITKGRIDWANRRALQIGESLGGRRVVAIRVMANCLLLYFDKGRCRFYSKMKQNWGNTGTMHIITTNYDRANLSKRILEQFGKLVGWYEQWIPANVVTRGWLMLEYNTKFS